MRTLPSEAIQMWCPDRVMSHEAGAAGVMLVGAEDQNVVFIVFQQN